MKKICLRLFIMLMTCILTFVGCGAQANEAEQVVIYSNADDEAVAALKSTLDSNGYQGKYIFQSFGTSELGGKMLAEGKDIEADIITMSSYYIDSAQKEHNMFRPLSFEIKTIENYPDFYAPFIANQGAIFVNTTVLSENNLKAPISLKELGNTEYKDFVSVPDITGSSTAWLMIQALVNEYGDDGIEDILTEIYKNADVHLEKSGSAPLKKVRTGEVAIGFGLRHQGVLDKEEGLPIDVIDPTEGNFTLTESLAVVDKGDKTKPLAKDMIKCIIEKGREDLMNYYPISIYVGESSDKTQLSANSKIFPESLTVELLEEHKAISEGCK